MTTHENGDQTVSDERDLKSHQIMELSRELERVRAAPLGDFAAAQSERLAAIEAAPDAPESLRERVARALWSYDAAEFWNDWDDAPEWARSLQRRRADAAITVMRGDS